MRKNLERLLVQIKKETGDGISERQVRYIRLLSELRREDYNEFVVYLHKYNEAKNAKISNYNGVGL